MNILVIGSGGREHALVWKIAQSPKVKKIYAAPGSSGIAELAECVKIAADDIAGLKKFAKKEKIDFTVVGPEIPLALGIVDQFRAAGLGIFGPRQEVARLESSKVFSKKIMQAFEVPTAEFEVFDNPQKAGEYVKTIEMPIVIKADGLAAGKGVIIAQNEEEAIQAIKKIMVDKAFGVAGDRIIIEECLEGEEASVLVISDGKHIVPLASAQDHKRIFDNDEGLNTGGMGAYSPAPVISPEMEHIIQSRIIQPIIDGLAAEGRPFKGVLYAGVMITREGPKTLEYNVRFGDPETQAILPRLKTDLLEVMMRASSGQLAGFELEWDKRSAVAIVMASGGYPGKYAKGKVITGIDQAAKMKDIVVFHAGTKLDKKKLITSGGRVLAVTGLASPIEKAIDYTYSAVKKIKFNGAHYRRDIGKRAINREV